MQYVKSMPFVSVSSTLAINCYKKKVKKVFNIIDVVIEVQFFKGIDGNLLPKEVAVLVLNDDFLCHWITSAPYNS